VLVTPLVLKLIIIKCCVSKGCTKGFHVVSNHLGSSRMSNHLLETLLKVRSGQRKVHYALIAYHYALETWQLVSYCFQCHLFIIFFMFV
jgi:hypothetical protein